ncbi:MAG: HRDC domain-containing protein [Deltaproteobacteria bacterium]|nr:HRDC domain-containing protein [Deltaproteobacteria bacterium]
MAAPIIEAIEPLQALASELANDEALAFDLEGDGLYRYRSQLCAVQLATAEGDVRIIDTLAVTDRSPLVSLLGPSGPRKTVHDVSFDARLLAENGVELGNVFDTSVSARYLDEPKAGLGALVEKYLDIKLPKGKQKADWGRRPLEPADLEYLAADVRYLLELGARLEHAIQEAGIEGEVRAETDYMLYRALTDEPDPRPAWARIKGMDDLGDGELAILREVAAVREEAAQAADVPPFKIVGNHELLEMARRRPKSKGALAKIPGATRGRARRFTREFLDAIQKGIDAGEVPAAEREIAFPTPPPRAERQVVKQRERALTKWRDAEAKQRKVNRQVVLPGHCVRDLATHRPFSADELREVPGLGEVRVERYGAALLKALDDAER